MNGHFNYLQDLLFTYFGDKTISSAGEGSNVFKVDNFIFSELEVGTLAEPLFVVSKLKSPSDITVDVVTAAELPHVFSADFGFTIIDSYGAVAIQNFLAVLEIHKHSINL